MAPVETHTGPIRELSKSERLESAEGGIEIYYLPENNTEEFLQSLANQIVARFAPRYDKARYAGGTIANKVRDNLKEKIDQACAVYQNITKTAGMPLNKLTSDSLLVEETIGSPKPMGSE